MSKHGIWPLVILSTAVTLGGCATTGAVRQVRIEAQAADARGRQALAAVKALRQKRQSSDQALAQTLARITQEQGRLLADIRRLRARERRPAPPKGVMRPAMISKAAANAFFGQVVARARALAAAPYKAPGEVPKVLQQLDFSQYSKISYVGRVPGWPAGRPFHIQLYPAGYLFTWPEKIRVIAGAHRFVPHLPVTAAGDPALAARLPKDIPPAGFSAYTGFGRGPAVDEFLSFLGASYFRAVGAGQSWGLSARGVAVDTALAHRAEEFPYFREFWLFVAHKGAHDLAFCALLDSPSLTGAYRFVVHPGADTVVDVKEVLFERTHVRRLGIAPLTSMFLQGRFSQHRFDPLIRSAHDSDGMAVALPGNGRLWWPLRDPKRIALYRFPEVNPAGFGLMQRARRAGDYRAYGMHYERRPNAWVTPEGNWGPGHLVLVELPTDSQTNDNISVFWVPKGQPPALSPMTFHYRIDWSGANPRGIHIGYVSAWRHARRVPHGETYVIDFAGAVLARFDPAALTPVVHVFGPARAVTPWLTRNAAGDIRMQFGVVRTGSGPVTIHAALLHGAKRVTETWANALPMAR
ncbi:glucan biosynthesis protein [Acidiferrobacter sp.]|uniref:glucan biosynthesis protein n=1 Tax=Acidiferrobacter sp. TaxID=1872107 RepID=UPI00261F3E2E|nr:glucan biosynthesis protein [Acidiferrobacter sp.]